VGEGAVGGGSALSEVAASVQNGHRRDKCRGAPESETRLGALAAGGTIEIGAPFQLQGVRGEGGRLTGVEVATLKKDETRLLDADVLLPFYGLSTDLGPIANWGPAIENSRVLVDPTTCETNEPGIFAIGDVAAYPHKLKLILTGFSEAAFAAHAIFPRARPGEALRFEHSTTKGVVA